ncbi:MAG: dipeptide epimerase [Alphaproteobacteria bacterium]|nr:dipeptide epimerase [Alphaproteobacteria bacterium]
MPPTLTLTWSIESWPIAGTFRIARGAKTSAEVIVATVTDGTQAGRGECVPYRRYGETLESVTGTLAAMARALPGDDPRAALGRAFPPGAARNAVDCALWDLEAKRSGHPVWQSAGLGAPKAVITAFTISLDTPDAMAKAAAAATGRPILKLKLGEAGADAERVRAVRGAAPKATLIADANEGWTMEDLARLAPALAEEGVRLIEQPLPAGADAALADFASPIPLCADESVHDRASLDAVRGKYAAINIKLDKAGGLTEAIALLRAAEAEGLQTMIGCMVATSLAMAPATLLAGAADWVDLDGPLLLMKDRSPAIRYDGARMEPPDRELWGG